MFLVLMGTLTADMEGKLGHSSQTRAPRSKITVLKK